MHTLVISYMDKNGRMKCEEFEREIFEDINNFVDIFNNIFKHIKENDLPNFCSLIDYEVIEDEEEND